MCEPSKLCHVCHRRHLHMESSLSIMVHPVSPERVGLHSSFPVIGFCHQYQVAWPICIGRLVSKPDCVIYTNTHTFCWLHSGGSTEILSGWFKLWITGGPRWLSLHLSSHSNVWSTFRGECCHCATHFPVHIFCTPDISCSHQYQCYGIQSWQCRVHQCTYILLVTLVVMLNAIAKLNCIL